MINKKGFFNFLFGLLGFFIFLVALILIILTLYFIIRYGFPAFQETIKTIALKIKG
jgi:hypothetical protein